MAYQFKETDEIKGEVFNFNNVGDSIQGTLVDKTLIEQTKYGKPCWMYRLKTEDGDIKSVWGRPLIDPVMKQIKLGQIVELRFTATQSSRKGSDLKVIKVFADPNVVDEDWLNSQEEAAMSDNMSNPSVNPAQVPAQGVDVNNIPLAENSPTPLSPTSSPLSPTSNIPTAPLTPPPAMSNPTEKLSLIGDLAKIKLGITDPNAVPDEVMKATGLAWLQNNYDKIIKKLEVLPDKQ